MTNVATLHLEELKKELEEYKELSHSRLQELDKLNEEKAQALNEIEKLKMDVINLKFQAIYVINFSLFLDPSPTRACHH